MKKLLFGICIVMLAACHGKKTNDRADTSSIGAVTAAKKLAAAPVTYTLNGLKFTDANAMVHAFLNYRGSYNGNRNSCIWFSQAEFRAMNAILQDPKENYDGVRFYFAKSIPDGEYELVIVLTKDGGAVDPADPNSRHSHNDFFLPTNPTPYSAATPPVALLNLTGHLDKGKYTVGADLLGPKSPCTPGNNCISTPNPHYISCDTAYRMVQKMTGDEINATSEWFDKGIIDQISGLINNDGGLRVYMSRHLKEVAGDDQKRHGFLMILTKLKGNIQKDDYECFTLKQFAQYLKNRKYGAGDGGDGGGTDNGEECPNACEGVTWP